jgi:alginate O-acetyltransferase complex protein AlgI
MLFSSFEFILAFLPITLVGYFFLNRLRLVLLAKLWLLFASLFFYGWWNFKYIPLIIGSILFNYCIGHFLSSPNFKDSNKYFHRVIFIIGVVGNILLLGYYKYADFFISNSNALLHTHFIFTHVILPLGISFFTLTQIAFLVDAYEGLVEEKKLLNYAIFVTFFPHLLAGPILHHRDMMPQFDILKNKVLSYRNLTLGLYLFLLGLFKKVIIADAIAELANAGFAHAGKITLIEAWVVSLAYTLQIYFDFSGYSDMAVGVGRMFNIDLPINFNSPYKATSIIDFWKRWHITLTDFITTYVYTPILRLFSKITFTVSLIAIFISMLISGFWHGAGWTFVLWGALHGTALVINHVWRRRKYRMNHFLSWFLTFNFVNIAFVFFRAKNLTEATQVIKAMFGANGTTLPKGLEHGLAYLKSFGVSFGRMFENINGHADVLLVIAALALGVFAKNSNALAEKGNFWPSPRNQFVIVVLILVNLFFMNSIRAQEFLYYGF